MSPLAIFQSAINALRLECYELANASELFLEVDEAGNIWLGEGNGECFRVYGWHMTHQKISQIIKERELKADEE